MKQTLEEAAIKIAEDCYEMPYDENFINMKLIKNAFEFGAEWHAKQSLWISVKDKAGCDTSGDCIVMVMNGDIFKADNGTHITDGIFKGPNDGGQWDTYEEALEAGIQKAVELI